MRNHTRIGRLLRGLFVFVLVLPLMGYFAPPASAFHPDIDGQAYCDEAGSAILEWTATRTSNRWFKRTTPDNSVRIDLLAGSTSEIGRGEFNTANGYMFGGLYDASALMGQTVRVKATSEQGFFRNAELTLLSSGGESRVSGDIRVPVCSGPQPNPPALGSIGDFVWNDGVITEANGTQDVGELGVSGVLVSLYDGSGTFLESTTTDESGHYLFSGLGAGTYLVEFVPPTGFGLSAFNETGPDPADSDANSVTGRTGLIVLAAGQDDLSWDAGIVSAEVSPTTVVNTAATVAAATETLPFTGGSSGGVGGAAVGFILLGGIILLAARDREEDLVVGRHRAK